LITDCKEGIKQDERRKEGIEKDSVRERKTAIQEKDKKNTKKEKQRRRAKSNETKS
jgi:hypothetical protein